MDLGGNTEVTKTYQVKIDTTGPTTTAVSSVTVKKGKKATFRFSFTDLSPGSVALSPTATVKIVIKKGAVTKKTLNVGVRDAGAALAYQVDVQPEGEKHKLVGARHRSGRQLAGRERHQESATTVEMSG